ncbi:hypothetical protein J6590_031077 [Homalodisca vitripennis]|nr:hypothetical protein J6590_031077 [Homalodisca vitripennis]
MRRVSAHAQTPDSAMLLHIAIYSVGGRGAPYSVWRIASSRTGYLMTLECRGEIRYGPVVLTLATRHAEMWLRYTKLIVAITVAEHESLALSANWGGTPESSPHVQVLYVSGTGAGVTPVSSPQVQVLYLSGTGAGGTPSSSPQVQELYVSGTGAGVTPSSSPQVQVLYVSGTGAGVTPSSSPQVQELYVSGTGAGGTPDSSLQVQGLSCYYITDFYPVECLGDDLCFDNHPAQ